MFRCIVVVAISLWAISPARSAEMNIDGLERDVSKSAAIISILHKKAKKALINAAQDRTFSEYFSSHEAGHKHKLKERIDNISLAVQNDFHVEEMCLIDPDGLEISRIVGDEIAYDLSDEEASAAFFAPAFAQKPRTAYISPIYMSPDVDKWVVAYVTPIVMEGEKKAILHYEHGLEVYQSKLSSSEAGHENRRLMVSEDGWILWENGKIITTLKEGSSDDPADYFEKFSMGNSTLADVVIAIDNGISVVDSHGHVYRGAYRKNSDWYFLSFKDVDSLVSQETE